MIKVFLINFQELKKTKMERFEFIVDKLNADEFISMETFWESISKNNSINSQQRFSPFLDKLDFFYVCLLIGLKNENKEDLEKYKRSQIVDKWTRSLKDSKTVDYIIGLYLSKITKNCENDKSKINIILNRVLDHNSDTKLSKDGMMELHQFAYGGYILILHSLENKTPTTLVKFLNVVYNLIK